MVATVVLGPTRQSRQIDSSGRHPLSSIRCPPGKSIEQGAAKPPITTNDLTILPFGDNAAVEVNRTRWVGESGSCGLGNMGPPDILRRLVEKCDPGYVTRDIAFRQEYLFCPFGGGSPHRNCPGTFIYTLDYTIWIIGILMDLGCYRRDCIRVRLPVIGWSRLMKFGLRRGFRRFNLPADGVVTNDHC